jgi:hypothetical protein
MIQYHWLIYNFKKASPTMKGQEKIKTGAKQEQPWIVQGSKKNNKQQQL